MTRWTPTPTVTRSVSEGTAYGPRLRFGLQSFRPASSINQGALGLYNPPSWWQMLALFVYAMVACLVLNDAVKVAMIKWRALNAVARKPVDVTPQIAKRAYALYEQRGRQDGRAVQDWEQAEREIRKDQTHK